MVFLKPGFSAFFLLIATAQIASAQRCPPNSRPEAVAFPGNLATVQCFCDPRFMPVNARCVRAPSNADRPSANDPARMLVAPMPSR